MKKIQDITEHLNKLNITSEEENLLLNFLEALAYIGIEYQENNKFKKDLNYV